MHAGIAILTYFFSHTQSFLTVENPLAQFILKLSLLRKQIVLSFALKKG